MKLAVDEILLVTSQLRNDQARLYEQTKLISESISHRILQTLLPTSGQPKLEFSPMTRDKTESLQQHEHQMIKDSTPQSSSDILIRIKSHAHHQDTHCISACKCACHKLSQFRSPHSVDVLLGVLFIGYSVSPFRAKRRCTAPDCKANRYFKVKVEYLFPLWFLRNAYARLIISSTGDPALCLNVVRARSGGSDIWRFIRSNDLESLQSLYSSGRGSPNDVYEYGRNALYVSTTNLLHTPYLQDQDKGIRYGRWSNVVVSRESPVKGI